MGRESWAFDDIVLGALLGAWLGTAHDLWATPLTGFIVASSVVAVVFFGRQVVMGQGRARRLAILPVVLAAAVIALEGYSRLVQPSTLLALLAILGVWAVAIGIRWWAMLDERATETAPAAPAAAKQVAPPSG